MVSILDFSDEFGGENMGNDLLDILDSSVSPVSLLNHYVGHNFSDALYVGWNSDISEEIARLELLSLVVPNLSDLKYNNYYSDSSSSNINRMPPVPPLHLRLDRNAKNSANESNNSRSDVHTLKVQYRESYIDVALENLQMKVVMPHGRTTATVDSTEQSEDASQLDKCQGQLIGKNSKVPLKEIAMGRRKPKKTYLCTECNKLFDRKDHLTRHLRSHFGEKRFECAVCGAGFCKQNFLNFHEKVHFGDRPFKCSVCGAAFQYKRELAIHQSTHTDYAPFVCDICKKTFRNEYNLVDHKNIHTGARPYECNLCNKTFGERNVFYKHRKSHKMKESSRFANF